MKATGIVRRIDDLGRVVIPKEIRRTMRIREGDPLEIYTDAGERVIFKKYSPIGELTPFAQQYAESLGVGTDCGVAVCDSDRFIAVAGLPKKEIVDKSVSPAVEDIIAKRRFKSFSSDEATGVGLVEASRPILAVAPIIASGDALGAVLLLGGDGRQNAAESDIKLIQVAASFLGKQMEQ